KKEKEKGIIKSLIRAVNTAVKGFNKIVPNKLKKYRLDEMDENQSASEIMSGGGALTLGLVDDAVKACQKFGLHLIRAIRLIEEEKKQRQAQYQELKNSIAEVTNNLNRVETQLTNTLNDFKSEVNERFEEQERKILANKQRIEEERRKREAEIQEINSKIKVTNTNLENLRQEKEELSDNFDKYKAQIDQKTAETQQILEDTQAEYQRKTAILAEQIKDNEEIINEFQEDLTNVR